MVALARCEPLIQPLRLMICAVGRCFQPIAIGDDDLLSRQTDEPSVLQIVEGDSDARPAHAQHQRQELMGERNLITAEAVIRHEQPSCQAFLQSGGAVGECCIRRLIHERMSKP